MKLDYLARLRGIVPRYRRLGGTPVPARRDALLATLRALGTPLDVETELDEAIQDARSSRWRRVLEPVLVVWDGRESQFSLRVPERALGQTLEGELRLEDGTEVPLALRLDEGRLVRTRVVNGESYQRLALSLPDLPWGYHELRFELGSATWSAQVICAPPVAHRQVGETRRWGLFAPLYALHSRENAGIGTFSEAGRFGELIAKWGGEVFSTLPFLASFLDEPFEPAPYSPASRLFWNELYVDPSATPEWSPDMELGVSSSDERYVDYRVEAGRRREQLERLARKALAERPDAMRRFSIERPEALDYARFRASTDYHLYCQMVAEEQVAALAASLEARGISFYLDLPLGVHPLGYDVWREPEQFVRDVTVGAPPDRIFPDGQDWSFPPLHPERSRGQGHRYFRRVVQHHMRHADLLRIDHVMGLHRQYWIPDGFEKHQGVYVRYPADELYAILCLESHRARTEVAGENLGTVPGSTDAALDRHGFRKLYVLQYALTGDEAQPTAPEPPSSVANVNTHDTPTLAGFIVGKDLDERVARGTLTPRAAAEEQRHRRIDLRALRSFFSARDDLGACLSALAASAAAWIVVSLDDLLGEDKPHNRPGTTTEFPNWRRRAALSLEELTERSELTELLKVLNRQRQPPRARSETRNS